MSNKTHSEVDPDAKTPPWYITFGTTIIAVATIIAVVVLVAKESDSTLLVVTALFGFAGTVISAQQRENHMIMNSRLSELLATTEKAALAKGAAVERDKASK